MKHTRYTIHDTPSTIGYWLLASRYGRARGVTVVLVLAFMAVFAMITASIAGYVLQQGKYGRAISAREQALHISEAGLEYYKWRLSHSTSTELTTGAALVSPYTYTVNDPEGGALGTATITATPALQCGAVQWIDLESKGVSNSSPGFPRTLLARYMKPSVAEYSTILNGDVRPVSQILGPYHSNFGIRMDGTNNSNVTSAVSTWLCDGSFGCSAPPPLPQSKPGIFGAGAGYTLWKWGNTVLPIEFSGMSTNFPDLQTKAQALGIALNPMSVQVGGTIKDTFSSVGNNEQKGFHLVFNPNGTVSVYHVTGTTWSWGKHIDTGWQQDYYTITNEIPVIGSPFVIPSGCSLIYSQAKTWIEGTIAGKVTVVVADVSAGTGSFNPDIILNNNINYYTATDGSVGLTAIAERSVLIPLLVPNAMSIRGIFVAQSGYYGRNLYDCTYTPYDRRASLTMNGTVVSNLRVVRNRSYSYCSGFSGFTTLIDSYDRLLAFSPPPFTPSTSVDYKLALWREK